MSEEAWHTAKELAGLPGMPKAHTSIHRRSQREGWCSRKRQGQGGGREYAFSSLPVATQAALLRRAQPAVRRMPTERVVDRDSLWSTFEHKTKKQKDEAARRLQALQGVERLVLHGSAKSEAIDATAQVFGESRATLYRWQKAVKGVHRSDWLAALAPGYVGGGASAEYTPEAWDYFKAQYLRYEAPTIAACHAWTLEAGKDKGWVFPAVRTVQRWVDAIPKTTRVMMRQGEDALMQLYPSQKRTVRDLHALYWINGDGYQHNVFVRFPNGEVDRPKTWFWQDIYSRRIVGFRADRTEHTDSIRLSLGDVLERFGIPEHATIDNTRAAANKWVTGGVPNRYRFKVKDDDPLGLMPQLGITVHWTTVFNGKGHGQAKPVERSFGVGGLGEYVDKRYEFKGAYTGPNVLAKPENYREAAVPFAQFCEVLADAIRQWNEKVGRRTEVCNGKLSYAEAFDASYADNVAKIRRATDTQRRLWLLTAEAVRVQRDASLSLSVGKGPNGKNRYGADCLMAYAKQKVVIRFDPDRLHESVHAYQLDGRYIGELVCLHAVGFGDTGAARDWAKNRTRRVKAAKQQTAAEQRMAEIVMQDSHPDLTPEDNTTPQTNVTRGNFAKPQPHAVGSDLVPDTDDSPAQKYSWDKLVVAEFEEWKKHQI